jgi:hypothetical protein
LYLPFWEMATHFALNAAWQIGIVLVVKKVKAGSIYVCAEAHLHCLQTVLAFLIPPYLTQKCFHSLADKPKVYILENGESAQSANQQKKVRVVMTYLVDTYEL